jgi:hypothetical protein
VADVSVSSPAYLSILNVTFALFSSQLADSEAIKLDMEDLPVFQENLDALVDGCLDDFPDDGIQDENSM